MKRLLCVLFCSLTSAQSGAGETPAFAGSGSESIWPPSLWEEEAPDVGVPKQGELKGPDDDIGTLPSTPTMGTPTTQNGELGDRVIVEPGETSSMNGVTVEVDPESEGNIVLYEGGAAGSVTVNCTAGSTGIVYGFEGGDNVMVGSNASIGAAGSGGTIHLYGPNGTISVHNSASQGGNNIKINTQAGRQFLPPGQSKTYSS